LWEEFGRVCRCRLEEPYNAVSRAKWDSDRDSEDKHACRNADSEVYAREDSDGMRAVLGTGLEAMCITLWQRT
jgi:hypothetical protein